MSNAAAENTRSVQKRLWLSRYKFFLFSCIQNIQQGHQVRLFCGKIQAIISCYFSAESNIGNIFF